MADEREELTADTLAAECTATHALIETVRRVVPIKSIDELVSFLDATAKSPAHARLLLDLLSKQQQVGEPRRR
jgi:hypothetical protein